jgi:hypothetical protein
VVETPSQAQLRPSKITKPKASDIGGDAPKIRSGAGKAALRFGKGLLLDQLVSMAIGLFVGYFQKKVYEENIRVVEMVWKDKIGKKLEAEVNYWIKKSVNDNIKLAKDQKYVYVRVEWTLMLRELRSDSSDVIVWFGKFAAQDPGFGEVYHGVRLDRGPEDYAPRNAALAEDEAEDREPNLREKGVNDYTFTLNVLVHDPDILQIARTMQSTATRMEKQFDRILDAWTSSFIRLPPPPDNLVTAVRSALEEYRFLEASQAMDRLARTMEALTVPTKSLKALSAATTSAVPELIWLMMSKKQRDLLDAYLGVHVEPEASRGPSLDRELDKAVKQRSGRSSTHHSIDQPGQKFH